MSWLPDKLPGQRASICYSALHKFGFEHKEAGLALRNKREELDFYLSDQAEFLQKRVKYLNIVWPEVLSGMNPNIRDAATIIKNQTLALANSFDFYKRSNYKPRINKVFTALHTSLNDAESDATDTGGRWNPSLGDSLIDIGGGELKLDIPSIDNESSNIAFIRVFLDRFKDLSIDDPARDAAMAAMVEGKKNARDRDYWNIDISKITPDVCLPGQPDPIEDLTDGWVKTEEVEGTLTISPNTKVTYANIRRREYARLTKSLGAESVSGDFEFICSSERTYSLSVTSIAFILSLASADKDVYDIFIDGDYELGGRYLGHGFLYLSEIESNNIWQDSISVGNVLQYMTFSRTGSNAVWDAYTDTERTILYDFTSLGLHSIETYPYTMTAASWDSTGGAADQSGYIQDIDFQIDAGIVIYRRRREDY